MEVGHQGIAWGLAGSDLEECNERGLLVDPLRSKDKKCCVVYWGSRSELWKLENEKGAPIPRNRRPSSREFIAAFEYPIVSFEDGNEGAGGRSARMIWDP